jgi:hypothetical protein
MVGRLTMHTEKHQFETKADRRYESVGRGGYAVGGIPWYNLYYGGYGYGYGSGYYGGSGTTKDLTEAEKSEIRMETYDGTATGSGEGTGYDSGSGAL